MQFTSEVSQSSSINNPTKKGKLKESKLSGDDEDSNDKICVSDFYSNQSQKKDNNTAKKNGKPVFQRLYTANVKRNVPNPDRKKYVNSLKNIFIIAIKDNKLYFY